VLPSLYLRFGHRRQRAALLTAEPEGNT
jgi:hypothetical protein